jgi:hypothetical protein
MFKRWRRPLAFSPGIHEAEFGAAMGHPGNPRADAPEPRLSSSSHLLVVVCCRLGCPDCLPWVTGPHSPGGACGSGEPAGPASH